MEEEGLFEGLGADFLSGGQSPDGEGFDPFTGTTDGKETEPAKKEEEPEADPKPADGNNDNKDPGQPTGQEEIAGFDPAELEKETIPAASGDDKTDDQGTPKSDESPSSPLTSLTSALKEDGVLSSLSDEQLEEIKTGGDLLEAIRSQISQNEFSDLNEDQKEYLKAIRAGVPDLEYLQAKKTAASMSTIEPNSLEGEDKVDLRKNVLIRDFMIKGFDQTIAEKYATRSIDLGEDTEDAKGALERIQAFENEKASNMIKEAESKKAEVAKSQQQRLDDLQAKVKNTDEVIPGIKVHGKTKDKIFDLMTGTAGYDANNNPMNAVVKNMIEDQDYYVKMVYLHQVTNGLKDWSKITDKAKTSAVNKLDAALQVEDGKLNANAGKATGAGGNKGDDGLLDALKHMNF